jgi:hypothetical protein
VEACSLLGELRGAFCRTYRRTYCHTYRRTYHRTYRRTYLVAETHLNYRNAGENMIDTTTVLYDSERFTRQFFPVISTASLQIYDSALLFTHSRDILIGLGQSSSHRMAPVLCQGLGTIPFARGMPSLPSGLSESQTRVRHQPSSSSPA